MSGTARSSKLSSTVSIADAALAARYNRLAGETTGFIRNVLLNLAAAAEGKQRPSQVRPETIDLHLVTYGTKPSCDPVRTYA